ncbi:MAG TPA: hypothetical protein VGY76_10630 [Solirubrobacteraceae bacterium]|jgi:hypothetical protein|nr:hypothetical protein [Solirubrobacteraceae bacterium]
MNVLIEPNTERRLWALIRAVQTEIGGWGYARLDGGDLIWEKVFLVPQEVSHSEVDFEGTGGDVAAVERAISDGVLDDPAFVWVSWHSHHSMKPFWSKTDNARIAAMAETGITRLLSFVGCHDGNHSLRLDVFNVQAHDINLGQVLFEDLELVSADAEFTESIGHEIAANVREVKAQSLCGTLTSMPAGQTDDERTLSFAEAFALKELMDHGFTHAQAILTIDEIGVGGVDGLIDSGDLFRPQEMLPLGGTD